MSERRIENKPGKRQRGHSTVVLFFAADRAKNAEEGGNSQPGGHWMQGEK